MVTSDAIDKISTALASAQGEMDGAKRGAVNPFFNSKYADLASVKDAIREPFAKAGLSVVQFPQTTFQGEPAAFEWTAKRSGEVRYGVRVFTVVTVLTRLMHTSGQWIEDSVSAMLPNGDPQAVGSAITYLRRYALQAVAGIAAEDDDAEATTQGTGPKVAVNAPIQHPSGYLPWLDGLHAVALTGTPALQETWKASSTEYRFHLTSTAPDKWETMKAVAARVVVQRAS
jgi:hypothetical protein